MDKREHLVSSTTHTAVHHEQVKWVKPELILVSGALSDGKTYTGGEGVTYTVGHAVTVPIGPS